MRQKGSAAEIQAVGRYFYVGSDNSCEVAFVTREKYKGKGMASLLLGEMIRIAKLRKLNHMVAYVRAENHKMLAVFERAGFKRLPSEDMGEVHLKLSLTGE